MPRSSLGEGWAQLELTDVLRESVRLLLKINSSSSFKLTFTALSNVYPAFPYSLKRLYN